MVIIITGSSHVGKTLLAQQMLEIFKYPYLSIDHLKMGLIRSGNTDLTPEDDDELTSYLWPIVREIIKTAIENKQNLIVEGCYIPSDWRKDFDDNYLSSIKFICLAMTEEYIETHFDEIIGHESEIESRLIQEDCTIGDLKECNRWFIEAFGNDIIGSDGDIDRKKLADVIFHDEEKRKQLNAIVHPYVREGLMKFFERNKDNPAVFAEVPLLFEAGWQDLFDMSVVITCSKETAIKRMMEDRDYTEEEALSRYESQLDPQLQISLADKVIYNDSSLSDLDHEINMMIRDLRKEIRNGNQSV